MKKRPKRTAKQTYVLQIIWGVLAIFVFVGLGYGVWYITRLPEQTIDTVVINGAITVSEAAVHEMVESELEGSYAGLIPRRFKHLYPEASITKLVDTIPQVKNLEVTRDDKTVTVSFSEYVPYALWCDETLERCIFVDEEGYAFMDAPKLTGGTMLRIVIDDEVMLLDKVMLKPERLEKAVELSQLFAVNFGFEVSVITVKDTGDVFYNLQGGASLYTAGAAANQETLENLSAILESDEFAHLASDNFKYIDLRFGNRVYVNEEIAVPVTSTSTATSSEEQIGE